MSTQYLTWEAFLAGTTHSYRLEWCRGKADQASRPRLKTPIVAKVTAVQVLDVLMAARGRCCCCGSLACVPRNSGGLEAMILGLTCGNASRPPGGACL
jgi:hypothetical protein